MDWQAQWARDGYCIMPAVFDAGEVAGMREDADFILDLILNSSLANRRHSRRLDIRRRRSGGIVVRKIQPIIDLGCAIAEFVRDERLVGPLATFMDDEPVLMEEKLNYKQPLPPAVEKTADMAVFRMPQDDDRFPVHNDWAYYKYNDYPPEVISSAIAIDACHPGNGTMKVFPGSHLRHIEHLRVRNGLEVPEGAVDPADAVPVTAPAGSVMFFHSRLIHTSGPNETDAPRRVVIFSHFPKAANMAFDLRNGPNRLAESPWEWRYQRMKNAGYRDSLNLSEAAA